MKTVTVYGPHYPIQIQVEVNNNPMIKDGTNVENTAASMLSKGALKAEDVIDPKILELGKAKLHNKPFVPKSREELNELMLSHGPGEIIRVQNESQQATITYLTKQLMELPNAFNLETGKLNQENDKAVMLYASLQATIEFAKFPITWKKADQ